MTIYHSANIHSLPLPPWVENASSPKDAILDHVIYLPWPMECEQKPKCVLAVWLTSCAPGIHHEEITPLLAAESADLNLVWTQS